MYPTIHDSTGNNLDTQGFGALADCISCEVTEELNGAFTLELTYPLNGLHSEYLTVGNIIMVKPSHDQTRQPFRIASVQRSFANNTVVNANHICYDLSGYPVRAAATYSSLAAVINAINGMTWNSGDAAFHQFTFDTDMTSLSSFSMKPIQTVRSWMGGQDGSILDVYGGEWVYDRFSCYLTSRRGRDTGYRISYGKNLAEYDKKRDYSTYTHICAYWTKSETTVYSDLRPTGVSGAFRCGYFDAGKIYENQPSVAQLNTTADAQASSWNVDVQTVTVTPAQIGNDVIGLGDGVLICYETVFSTRVIKTVWDALIGKYISLTLGTKQQNIADTIKTLTNAPDGSSSSGSSGLVLVSQETVYGQNTINIPATSEWRLMLITCFDPNSRVAQTTVFNEQSFSNSVLLISGYYYSSGDYGLCNVNINLASTGGALSLRNFIYGGANYTSNTATTVRLYK